jgi:alcohol dehydrogenase class IV
VLKLFKDQEVYFGEAGSTCYLNDRLAEWKCGRILFVTGKDSFFRSGAAGFLKEAGAKAKFRFSEFEANPTCSDLIEGINFFESVNPDCIVAVGGGSVLDMAKLINFFGVNKINPTAYLEKRTKSVPAKDLLSCIAIPTTAGTGSEATHFSVLYNDKVKYSVADPRMVPDAVILNPALTAQMDSYQTACTGMDALAQGIESYWAVGATDESREYAGEAVRQAWSYLERAVRNPDPDSRQKMQEAAYWSGRAINISKTTLCHALSYSLTSYFGYPHGHAVGLFLPAVFALHLERGAIPAELPEAGGCRNGEEMLGKLSGIAERLGLVPTNTFTQEDMEWISSQADLDRMNNNPVATTRELIYTVLNVALNRKIIGDCKGR